MVECFSCDLDRSMPNLFASAASGLLGDRSENSDATDVRRLLEAVDYLITNNLRPTVVPLISKMRQRSLAAQGCVAACARVFN
jgi:hypothetical protein